MGLLEGLPTFAKLHYFDRKPILDELEQSNLERIHGVLEAAIQLKPDVVKNEESFVRVEQKDYSTQVELAAFMRGKLGRSEMRAKQPEEGDSAIDDESIFEEANVTKKDGDTRTRLDSETMAPSHGIRLHTIDKDLTEADMRIKETRANDLLYQLEQEGWKWTLRGRKTGSTGDVYLLKMEKDGKVQEEAMKVFGGVFHNKPDEDLDEEEKLYASIARSYLGDEYAFSKIAEGTSAEPYLPRNIGKPLSLKKDISEEELYAEPDAVRATLIQGDSFREVIKGYEAPEQKRLFNLFQIEFVKMLQAFRETDLYMWDYQLGNLFVHIDEKGALQLTLVDPNSKCFPPAQLPFYFCPDRARNLPLPFLDISPQRAFHLSGACPCKRSQSSPKKLCPQIDS